jgi:hypothetical protein
MLVVQLKPDDEIRPRIAGKKLFILECFGCQDVYFPHAEVDVFIKNLGKQMIVRVRLDYLCNRDFVGAYIKKYSKQIQEAEMVLVFSCGVGAQVVASLMEHKVVYTCCDTLYLNGFQGLNVQQFDCYQCGECYLNYTGGVCPLANCSKGLVNGPCGGAKGGKCEVNPEADCAWVVIYKRLEKLKKLDILKKVLAPRNYSKVLTQSLSREKVER